VRAKRKSHFDNALTHRLYTTKDQCKLQRAGLAIFFVKPTMKTEFPLVETDK
jgi:hypothetical protein